MYTSLVFGEFCNVMAGILCGTGTHVGLLNLNRSKPASILCHNALIKARKMTEGGSRVTHTQQLFVYSLVKDKRASKVTITKLDNGFGLSTFSTL